MFERELQFFKDNQDALVAEYRGKVLVIRGQQVVDAKETPLAAYTAAAARFEPGTFMLQPCEAGEGAYSVTIASSEVMVSAAAR